MFVRYYSRYKTTLNYLEEVVATSFFGVIVRYTSKLTVFVLRIPGKILHTLEQFRSFQIDLSSIGIELSYKLALNVNESLLVLRKFIFSFFVYTDLMVQYKAWGSAHVRTVLMRFK